MDDVHYITTRFDPELAGVSDIFAQLAAAVGYTATLSIGRRLEQLLRLRVARLNPWYCLILHTRATADVAVSAAEEPLDEMETRPRCDARHGSIVIHNERR